MSKMQKPNSSTYGDRIKERLDHLNLTIYGASQMLAAETDEPLKTVHERIRRYLKNDPESLTKWIEVVELLGGKVTIAWKD